MKKRLPLQIGQNVWWIESLSSHRIMSGRLVKKYVEHSLDLKESLEYSKEKYFFGLLERQIATPKEDWIESHETYGIAEDASGFLHTKEIRCFFAKKSDLIDSL